MSTSNEATEKTGLILEKRPLNLVPTEGVVEMAISVEELKKRMNSLEEIKRDILKPTDFADFKAKDGKDIRAIRKTGWLKFAVAFNLTTIIVKEEKIWIDQPNNKYAWHITTQCIAPNGRVSEEIGVCDNHTDRPNAVEHVIKTMAKTRGTSRAISVMVGAADTSADDLGAVKDITKSKTESELCTCQPEDRKPSENLMKTGDHLDCLSCGNCNKPMSPTVSAFIINKREESHS